MTGNNKYRDLHRAKLLSLPSAFLNKAEGDQSLSNDEVKVLREKSFEAEKDDLIIGTFEPEQFVLYGTYDGPNGTEFLCQILSIDEDLPIINEEIETLLRREIIKACDIRMDGFLTDGVQRYDFEKNDWLEANEHVGETAGQKYFFYDDNDLFFDMLQAHRDEYEAKKAMKPTLVHSNVEPQI